MANQRDRNKVMVGVYIDSETRDAVKEVLASHGITMTDFIVAQFYKLLKKEEDLAGSQSPLIFNAPLRGVNKQKKARRKGELN